MEIIQLGIAEALHIGKAHSLDLEKGKVRIINGWEVFTDNKYMDILVEFTTNQQHAEKFKRGRIAEAVEIRDTTTGRRIELITIKKNRAKTDQQRRKEHRDFIELEIATYTKLILKRIKELEQC